MSSSYKDVAHLESLVFEIFDEIDSTIIGGLNETTLSFFLAEGWIDENTRRELAQFRDHINKIDSQYWNPDDFDYLEDWKLARDSANVLTSKLKIKKEGGTLKQYNYVHEGRIAKKPREV